jgi:hypothetical protein
VLRPIPIYRHAVTTTPAGSMELCSLVPFHRLRLSPFTGRVSSCIAIFEAYSVFTHVTACRFAESPM